MNAQCESHHRFRFWLMSVVCVAQSRLLSCGACQDVCMVALEGALIFRGWATPPQKTGVFGMLIRDGTPNLGHFRKDATCAFKAVELHCPRLGRPCQVGVNPVF
eukprot:scaffold34974_cov19-Tisochrysis_lutea.AAC.1